MTARECASMLRNNRIFQSVGEDRLERLVENADMQTFRRGDEILSPSRGGRIMGMIIAGSAAVNKGRAVINTLVPGDIFGADTLSDAQNRGSDRRRQREQTALLSARTRAGRRG